MDEIVQAPAPKRRGRPPKNKNPELQGRPPEPRPVEREAKRNPPHAEPVWADTVDPFADDADNPLQIAPEILPQELSFRWVRVATNGQPDPVNRANAEKAGWRPIYPWYFNGILDGRYAAKGDTKEITFDGSLVLMGRHRNITDRARKVEYQKAREQVLVKERELMGGDMPGITLDAGHKSAVGSNKISKSFERIDVPKD